MSTKNYIFILGIGRSGTSLLQSILDSNSKIKFLRENQFLRKVLYGKKNIKWFLENRRDRLEHLDMLIKNQNLNKIDFYKVMIQNELKPELIYIGDKDPNLLDFIEKLIMDFPKSKIILTVRDPRDVILSRMSAKWSSKWPFFFQVLIVYSQFKNYFKFLSKNNLASCQIHTVKYENLLSDPQLIVEGICEFLKLEYEKEMLDFTSSAKRLVSKNEMEWKSKTLQKLDKNNFDKWKNHLSTENIYFISKVFEKILLKYNYDFHDTSELSVLSKFYFSAKIKLIKIFSNLYNLRYK